MINFDFDVNKVAEQVKAGLEQVTNVAGVTGAKLIEVGVRGNFAEGVADLVMAVLLLGINFFFLKRFFKRISEKDFEVESGEGAVLIIGGILSIVTVVVMFSLIYNGIFNVLAPEYRLMMDVVEKVFSK